MNGNSGDTYCLVDDRDGTAHLTSKRCGNIGGRFSIGYSPGIASRLIDGQESVFIRTDDGVYLRFDRPDPALQTVEFDSSWKGLPDISIPYDVNAEIDDGCHGTDWFFQDDPIRLYVKNGALYVGNGIIMPGMVTWRKDVEEGQFYVPTDESWGRSLKRIGDMLECASSTARTPELQRQLSSALLMLRGDRQQNLEGAEGPYRFGYADIDVSLEKGDVVIGSGGAKGQPITNLDVGIKPNGLFNDSFFRINRLGMMYQWHSNCDRDGGCGIPFIQVLDLGEAKRGEVLGLLDDALASVTREQDKETIRKVREVVSSPNRPAWLE